MLSSSFPYLLLIFSLIPSTQSRPATSLPSPTSNPSTALRLVGSSSTTTPPFSVTDFGAIGDGIHYDTPHIQTAIDACHTAGGGQVLFPPGDYLTATIHLRSGVVLNIRNGARVLGGPRLIDYPTDSKKWYVIVAEDATDVGITGGGVIDGQGLKFVERFDERKNVMVSWNKTGACYGDECRPRLVGFLRCRNVHVSDVLLTEPAYWW